MPVRNAGFYPNAKHVAGYWLSTGMQRMEDKMKSSTFTVDQITELRAIEKTRMGKGESGLRAEVQSLIIRLKSGGVGAKIDDPRVVQAKKLWDKGFGEALGIDSFDVYLVTIPDIPDFPYSYKNRFPVLVLVDARLGITKTCDLLGAEFDGDDQTFVDYDPEQARTEKVYWIRAQDGEKNNGKSVRACRNSFTEDELGLTVHEGLAFFAQNPEGLRGRGMDLPGSVTRDYRDFVAYLCWVCERSKLSWSGVDHPSHKFGSASRGK